MKRKVGDIGYQIEFEDLDFKRYIRTSDNIFDLQSYSFFIIGKAEDDLRKPEALNVENRFFIHTRNSSQADTIEELFDEIVIDGDGLISPYSIKSNGEVLWKYKKDNSYTPVTFTLDKVENVFGAIWTDEGLIYKAKMKGVLLNGEIDWELL